jgi:hypothetical protein
MEQTLVSEESQTLISRISKLTIFDQFAQTIFVEHHQGIVEVEKSYREENSLKFVRTEIAYTLKNHRVISKKLSLSNVLISDLTENATITVDKSVCRCVSSNLNKLFIRELNRFQDLESCKFNLYSQNIIKRFFYPNKKNDLVKRVIEVGKDMSWAIIPYNLLNVFYESEKLELCKETSDRIIYKLGRIEKLDIYVNPDDETGKIFFGNFDSIIILANKFINVYENSQGTNYNFEYLFLEQGKIKGLQVV